MSAPRGCCPRCDRDVALLGGRRSPALHLCVDGRVWPLREEPVPMRARAVCVECGRTLAVGRKGGAIRHRCVAGGEMTAAARLRAYRRSLAEWSERVIDCQVQAVHAETVLAHYDTDGNEPGFPVDMFRFVAEKTAASVAEATGYRDECARLVFELETALPLDVAFAGGPETVR